MWPAAASSDFATRLGVVNVGLTPSSSKEFDAPAFDCETGKERKRLDTGVRTVKKSMEGFRTVRHYIPSDSKRILGNEKLTAP
jgi:hypothetical protein